jgi:ABC-type multidrug transport system permease subunit
MRPTPLWQLTLTRLRLFWREPSAVFWTFGFPLGLSLALGVAFRNRPPEPVRIGVVTADERVTGALASAAELKASVFADEREAREALRTSKVDLVVESKGHVEYVFDPTRPESRLARLVVDDALQRAEGRVDPTPIADARVTEPGSRYIDFLVPGLLGLGLMQGGLWGLGYTIVDMRTRKLMKRLLATPMRRLDFLLSFVLMRLVFLAAELPILLGFGWLVFGVPVRGSLILLTAVAVLGSLVFSGVSLLVASRAENTQTVGGLINLVSMPMFIASGTFFSSSRFPDVVQPLVRALPLTALNDALRAIMLDGAGPVAVLRPALVMAAWGIVSFAIALRIFRWR